MAERIAAPPPLAQRYQLDTDLGRLARAERVARGRQPGRRSRGTATRCSTRRQAGPTRSPCWRSRRGPGVSRYRQAMREFAAAYADQNERDYRALTGAVASGRVTAEKDL